MADAEWRLTRAPCPSSWRCPRVASTRPFRPGWERRCPAEVWAAFVERIGERECNTALQGDVTLRYTLPRTGPSRWPQQCQVAARRSTVSARRQTGTGDLPDRIRSARPGSPRPQGAGTAARGRHALRSGVRSDRCQIRADGCLAVLCSEDANVRVWTFDRQCRTIWQRHDGTAVPLAVS
jgi:hypothetical protein